MSSRSSSRPGLRHAHRLKVPGVGAQAAVVVTMALGVFAVQAPLALAAGGGQPGAASALAPTISSFLSAAGTAVTVNGTGFAGSDASCTGTTVIFHAIKASACTSVSATRLKATVPLPASSGPIRVQTAGGSATSAAAFTVTPPMRLSPRTGPPTAIINVSGGLFAQRAFTVAARWDQFGRVPRHTHANPYENTLSPGNVPGLAQAWRYPTGNLIYSSPAVVNGVVYITSFDHNVYALNAATGAKRWSYTTGGQISSSPAVVNGVVYIGSYDHRVYALNAKTGARLWSYATSNAVYSSPAVANGVVYVGSVDHNIYALNAATGAKRWSYDAAAPIYQASPAVANGVVYAGGLDSLFALDAATGAVLWSSGAAWGDSSPAVANGVVYIGSADGSVYAFDVATGAKRWSYATSDLVYSSPAVANGVVYIGSDDGNVYALNAATGAKRWSYQTGAPLWEASPAVVNGAVYIGSNSSSVYAFGLPAGP
jgi:outer membrane protein assembly factor BamB